MANTIEKLPELEKNNDSENVIVISDTTNRKYLSKFMKGEIYVVCAPEMRSKYYFEDVSFYTCVFDALLHITNDTQKVKTLVVDIKDANFRDLMSYFLTSRLYKATIIVIQTPEEYRDNRPRPAVRNATDFFVIDMSKDNFKSIKGNKDIEPFLEDTTFVPVLRYWVGKLYKLNRV